MVRGMMNRSGKEWDIYLSPPFHTKYLIPKLVFVFCFALSFFKAARCWLSGWIMTMEKVDSYKGVKNNKGKMLQNSGFFLRFS